MFITKWFHNSLVILVGFVHPVKGTSYRLPLRAELGVPAASSAVKTRAFLALAACVVYHEGGAATGPACAAAKGLTWTSDH